MKVVCGEVFYLGGISMCTLKRSRTTSFFVTISTYVDVYFQESEHPAGVIANPACISWARNFPGPARIWEFYDKRNVCSCLALAYSISASWILCLLAGLHFFLPLSMTVDSIRTVMHYRLSPHAIDYRWCSPPRVHWHMTGTLCSPQGSPTTGVAYSDNLLDEFIIAPLFPHSLRVHPSRTSVGGACLSAASPFPSLWCRKCSKE